MTRFLFIEYENSFYWQKRRRCRRRIESHMKGNAVRNWNRFVSASTMVISVFGVCVSELRSAVLSKIYLNRTWLDRIRIIMPHWTKGKCESSHSPSHSLSLSLSLAWMCERSCLAHIFSHHVHVKLNILEILCLSPFISFSRSRPRHSTLTLTHTDRQTQTTEITQNQIDSVKLNHIDWNLDSWLLLLLFNVKR